LFIRGIRVERRDVEWIQTSGQVIGKTQVGKMGQGAEIEIYLKGRIENVYRSNNFEQL